MTAVTIHELDCKTAVFFANVSDGPYSNERSGASEKTAREPAGRVRPARFTLEDLAYGASRLPKTSENDCFAVYSRAERSRKEKNDNKSTVGQCFKARLKSHRGLVYMTSRSLHDSVTWYGINYESVFARSTA